MVGSRLQVEEAVELQPPTRQQVYRYLKAAGTDLADAQRVVDDDETVWEVLQSPLVLSIVALTYQGRSTEVLRAPGGAGRRLEQLLTDYVERMFEHRPAERWTKAQMLGWLAQLARAMRDRNQTEFHLDRLRPDWLPAKSQRRLVALVPATAVGLAFGLINGFIGGLAAGGIAGMAMGLAAALVLGMTPGLSRTLAIALVGAVAGGLAGTMTFGPTYGLSQA